MAKKRICVWWDSIVWGKADYERWWRVTRLRNYFLSNNLPVKVYNLGIDNEDTNGLVPRFQSECLTRKPDIIFFAIGVNDSQFLDHKKNRVPLNEFHQNINQLYTQAKQVTDNIIFLNISNIDEHAEVKERVDAAAYHMKYIDVYNDDIKDFCLQNNISLIDVSNILVPDDLSDGLHPNVQWHEKIYLRVRDFLLDSKLV